MDPLRHPDLVDVSRRLRRRWEQVVDAEQAAARTAARRSRSIRDRLLEAEDRTEHLTVRSVDGRSVSGAVEAVGSDHLILRSGRHTRFVYLHQIVAIGFDE